MQEREKRFTGYRSASLGRSRELRKSMTPQERRLWYEFLRSYPIKVYRQRSIGPYIADFFCHAAQLVIEVDGGQHFTPEGLDHDRIRTQVMGEYGLTVLRFDNGQVDRQFAAVCQEIDRVIRERLSR